MTKSRGTICSLGLNLSSHSDDEFFIDGTFVRRAEGFGQMLTIMLRKKEQERAIPCLFSFLNREHGEKDWWFLWWTIKYLVPKLGNIQKIQMTVHYDKEIHNAIRTHWPDAQIVGCLFHQHQAIDEWIKQGVYKEHVLKSNSSVSLSLKQDIKILACSNFTSDDQFQRVVNQFVTKWRPIAGEKFMNYMIKTWLGNAQITPRFGPERDVGTIQNTSNRPSQSSADPRPSFILIEEEDEVSSRKKQLEEVQQ